MIRLDFLASRFNEILGYDKYCVYLHSNAFPDEDLGSRNIVTMTALRVPFGFSTEELDAESMTLTLTFDLPCEAYGADVIIRDGALAQIQTLLLGHRKFFVEQPDGKYVVNTYLEQQPPASPYIDSGRITQQIVLAGSALVQSISCGAVVGNDIKVSIDGIELLKTTRVANTQVGADNNMPLSEDKTLPEFYGISRTHTKTLTFLYTGKDIEKEFLKIAEGMELDVNKVYSYKVVYPAFTLTVPIKLVGVSSEDSAGVWLKYTLTVQTVGDAEVT